MHRSKRYEISSADDLECNVKRDELLEFWLDYDDERPAKALVVFINGIRSADYAGYEAHLAESAVREFGVAMLRVEYHCINSRPQVGASICMDKTDKQFLIKTCEQISNLCKIKINFGEELLNDNELSQAEFQGVLNSLDQVISMLKNQGIIKKDSKIPLQICCNPTKNEYQNFGLLQALDIANAISFIKYKSGLSLERGAKTLLFGTSHGGFVAYLAAKFTPWLIDAVVDNSAYIEPKFVRFEQAFIEGEGDGVHFRTYFHVKTPFSNDKNSPNFYSPNHAQIRNAGDLTHLQILAKYRKIPYISYHSAFDKIATPQAKLDFYENLTKLGFEAKLHFIEDESAIDGKFIKNIEHGFGMSMKELLRRNLPALLEMPTHKALSDKNFICYPCGNLLYKFWQNGEKVEFELEKI